MARNGDHRPAACRDPNCPRVLCQVYKQGFEDGFAAGFEAGAASAQND